MDTPFMDTMADGLAGAGLRCVRFEFPYMAKRREDGRKRGPDRMPRLLESWTETLAALDDVTRDAAHPLLIGGKSMGGRAAATFAANPDLAGPLAGVVCLGYPFHPPGKPENTRLEPLARATRPTLVVQGERDTLGNREDVAGYALRPPVEIAWIPDGDHSFVPRKRSGHTPEANLALAVQSVTDFVARIA
ncbi:MAG: dienelactone hydrolase family protein [Alphaproteobacteria bacterium]|nr:dienelactone hydrolase family protein [Alphaproteobacteria bacterium]